MNPKLVRYIKAGILSGLILGIIVSLVASLFFYISFLNLQTEMESVMGITVDMSPEKQMFIDVIIGSWIQLPIYIVLSILIVLLIYFLKFNLNYIKIFFLYFIIFFLILALPTLFSLFSITGYSGVELPSNYAGPNPDMLFFDSLLKSIVSIFLISILGSALLYYFLKRFAPKEPEDSEKSEEQKIKDWEKIYG